MALQRHLPSHIAAGVALLLVCLPLLFFRLGTAPATWYDEGPKMNSARLLAEQGVFGLRRGNTIILFDDTITGGPFEIGAMALSFQLFGPGVLQARAVMAICALLVALLIYRLMAELERPAIGLFVMLFVIAAPPIGGVSLLHIGRQVLAETPAMLLVLVGLLLWFRSWRDQSLRLAVLAGLACGIGLISKPQFGFALLPTLALIGGARWWLMRDPLPHAIAPSLAMVGAFCAWIALSTIVPQEVNASASDSLSTGIQVNLITGLWGSALSRGAIILAAASLLGAAYGYWRLIAGLQVGQAGRAEWAAGTLATLALSNMLWFSLSSIGWARYAYLGHIPTLMLLGQLAWALLEHTATRLQLSTPQAERLRQAAQIGLVVVAVMGHLPQALAADERNAAEQVASYIDNTIAPSAVIETWEWQVGALSQHILFNYPAQRHLHTVMRQQSLDQPFQVDYDTLAANPDYLLVGPFSDLTGIYSHDVLSGRFVLELAVGPYRVYSRRY
jgi:4-amino-4-deoxy-L-arabinose transferase-like glycosyltransferase